MIKITTLITLSLITGIYANQEIQWMPYKNDTNLSKTLCIANTDKVSVHIKGITEENYDFVSILDKYNTEKFKKSGLIDEHINIKGSCITAKLNSDGDTTKKGIKITLNKQVNYTPSTVWHIGPYENNENISKLLTLVGASNIRVHIEGEVEDGYDFIILKDKNGNKIGSYTGALNKDIILVNSDGVTVQLISDSHITKKGASISIYENTGQITEISSSRAIHIYHADTYVPPIKHKVKVTSSANEQLYPLKFSHTMFTGYYNHKAPIYKVPEMKQGRDFELVTPFSNNVSYKDNYVHVPAGVSEFEITIRPNTIDNIIGIPEESYAGYTLSIGDKNGSAIVWLNGPS